MRKVTELNAQEAATFFLKGSSYFNGDFPDYISFQPILSGVSAALKGRSYREVKQSNPDDFSDVNYSFVANKDGRFAWRPYELMHPVIYVSLVNLICSEDSWNEILHRFNKFAEGAVTCCSVPVVSEGAQSDQAMQVSEWWQEVGQKSLCLSLEFSHVLHTDVTDCYGALYTHSVAWAIHGMENAKASKRQNNLLGDKIDSHIRAGRYGQTNGISQGSVLMDFVAELVLGYVDELITRRLSGCSDFRILRYRDDYRVFTNSDVRAEEILKIISDELRVVGMRLGASKTFVNSNVVEGSIKSEKFAAINQQDLGEANAKTIQKQLLRLHAFGRQHPNSGALRRLLGELHSKIIEQQIKPQDLEVQVAIATDIASVSPRTFPAIAGILSHLISLEQPGNKEALWDKVYKKMSKVPYNGYLQVWLQRVTKPKTVGLEYLSDEPICKIVNGENVPLWNNSWISSPALLTELNVAKILVKEASESPEVVPSSEVELFNKNAEAY